MELISQKRPKAYGLFTHCFVSYVLSLGSMSDAFSLVLVCTWIKVGLYRKRLAEYLSRQCVWAQWCGDQTQELRYFVMDAEIIELTCD